MTYQETANVRPVELDEAPYREYREHLVRYYAADKVRAGAWSQAEAASRAAKDVDGLLLDGPTTSNQFLYSVRLDLLRIVHPATSENNEQKCLLAYRGPLFKL
jgi:hypothetical protein